MPEDAPRIRELANDRRIADRVVSFPHPYPEGMAEQWIATHRPKRETGEAFNFGIELCRSGELVGSISIEKIADGMGEVGYWLGVDWWGQGLMTEACRTLCRFGFEVLGLDALEAHHLQRNPASGRVLQKAGFVRLGTELRQVGEKKEAVVLYRCAAPGE